MTKDVRGEMQHVTIVGGGVIGCFLAYRLARAGETVTLLEKQTPGAGASGASAGNVQPVTGDNIAFEAHLGIESLNLYRKYLPDIKKESGIDPQDQNVRYFYAATNAEEERQSRDLAGQLAAAGLRASWIDASSARELDHRLSPEIVGGMLHEDCIQMDPQRFVSALARAAQAHGAKIRRGEAVGIDLAGSRVAGVRLGDGSLLASDAVILAMGPWSGTAIQDWFGLKLPIEPLGLQKVHLGVSGPPLGCAVRWNGVNIVQRRDGFVHVGSMRDPAGFEAAPEPVSERWLLERVGHILPGLDWKVAQARSGCAALTHNGMPILGPLPGLQGVYAAVPSTDGFLMAAVVADILVNFMLEGQKHPLMNQMLPEAALSGSA